jgi:hypothetical protein
LSARNCGGPRGDNAIVTAMKVTGPGQGPEAPGGAPDADTPQKAEAAGEGETFAEKLQGGAPSAGADAPAARLDPAERLTADLAEDLRAGKVGMEAALEQVVERIIDGQAGPHAPQAVRDSLRAALRDALEHDPFVAELAEKLRRGSSTSEP